MDGGEVLGFQIWEYSFGVLMFEYLGFEFGCLGYKCWDLRGGGSGLGCGDCGRLAALWFGSQSE